MEKHNNKAIVHLVALGKRGKNYHDIPSNDYLNRKYPGITNMMKRGDIIENVTESGYRSQGIYMWNGKKVIERNTDWDDYGSPSTEFRIITEFPPGYWDQCFGSDECLPVKNWCRIDAESQFYWHSDYPECALNTSLLKKCPILTKDDNYWITFIHDSTEYTLHLYNPEVFREQIKNEEYIPVCGSGTELSFEG